MDFMDFKYRMVECADGFTMSVQASEDMYSCPRENTGPYTSVEVGYPSEPEELLEQYAEDPEKLVDTVYPFVPVATVGLVLAKHGGMVDGEVPEGVPKLVAQGK